MQLPTFFFGGELDDCCVLPTPRQRPTIDSGQLTSFAYPLPVLLARRSRLFRLLSWFACLLPQLDFPFLLRTLVARLINLLHSACSALPFKLRIAMYTFMSLLLFADGVRQLLDGKRPVNRMGSPPDTIHQIKSASPSI